jgi:hypothetical protein
MSNFKAYQHVERLETSSIDGLLDGICHIFPKLDGTNACVWVENEKVVCGSRNRVLQSLKIDDNYGFCAWINHPKNIVKFTEFFKKYPTYRVYGEWLIPQKIQYTDDAYNKFYIFDILDGENYLEYDIYAKLCNEWEFLYIPRLAVIDHPITQDLVELLYKNTYCTPEGLLGEGLVIKRYDYKNRFKIVKWGKLILADIEEKNKLKNKEKVKKTNKNVEKDIVTEFLPQSIIDKLLVNFPHESDKINEFQRLVWETFLNEEAAHFLLNLKEIVDITKLRSLVYFKAKTVFLNGLC